MVSAAPHSDLQYCQTATGATWQNVVDCFFLYFETRDAAKLNLGDSPITYVALMGAIAKMVKQVLTWHLTNGNAYDCVQVYDCVQANVAPVLRASRIHHALQSGTLPPPQRDSLP